jgi:outer membrane protein assembly factor BamB
VAFGVVCCLLSGGRGAHAALAEAPWAKFRGDGRNTGRGTGSGADGTLRWTGVEPPDTGYMASPVIGEDGTVYIAGAMLRAYEGATGALLWQSAFPAGSGFIDATAAIGGDGELTILGQNGDVYKADARTGAVSRLNRLATTFASSAALGADGTIYAGGSDALYALDGVTATPKWSYATNGAVDDCPAVADDGSVYFGDANGTVYAVHPNTHQEKWASTETGADPIRSSPALGDDGRLFVGSDNGNVYALSESDGHVLWTFPTDGPVQSSPAIGANGLVYAGSSDGALYAIYASTGLQAWKFTTGGPVESSPALGSDGTVYVASQDAKLYGLDGLTGRMDWCYALLPYSGTTNSPAVGADGTVYAAASSGPLTAVRSARFARTDAAGVLRIAGGTRPAPSGDAFARVNREGATGPGARLDLLDAVRLARLAAGTDPLD